MNNLLFNDFPKSTEATASQLRPKVLVIGASGFLGSKILQQLEKNPTVTLRAMSRRGAPFNATAAVEWVRGDLMDSASLDAALKDVDVVVSSANGYMKETIEADFQGNKNLIEAAARKGVKRFVFLSIVACDAAPEVPHFHAKAVAEDLIKISGMPYVFVRAPAFIDQSVDYLADGVKVGRFYGVGDKHTKWSYVLTDDLAVAVTKAATYPGADINYQTIDIGWRDGAKSQLEMAQLIAEITGKSLSLWLVPWWLLSFLVRVIKPISELGYDLLQMFLFFRKGRFVSDTTKQEQFLGPAPTARDAITRWARGSSRSN